MLLLAAGCAVEALGIDQVGLTALMAFIPAVLIIQVLPLGIGGLGVREGTLVVFLSGIDVPSEQALALGLSICINACRKPYRFPSSYLWWQERGQQSRFCPEETSAFETLMSSNVIHTNYTEKIGMAARIISYSYLLYMLLMG